MQRGFSPAGQLSISRAQHLAVARNSGCVEDAHLFMGVLQVDSGEDGVVAALLEVSGVTREEARLYALSAVQTEGKGTQSEPLLSSGAQRVLGMAHAEAHQVGSTIVGPEHIFIACIRHRRGPHVGEVLRPLGFDAAKLREHLRGLNHSNKPYSQGNPLNHLTETSKKAVEAAHAAMRASYCGRISTAHLLLGVLANTENFAVETLQAVGVDVEALKREVRDSIFNDGEVATPQKKFSPAAKRALERAKKEATQCGTSFIEPHHLLYALLPSPASIPEKLAFGSSVDDPLEKVWPHWPVADIQSRYEARWKTDASDTSVIPVTEPTEADLTDHSKKALTAAQAAMRASSCGQMATTHLLLGILQDANNFAVETLQAAKVDIEALKREVRASIVSDGLSESPQLALSPTARRALSRAKGEATVCGHLFIGPHHLLYALLPHAASPAENAAFGSNLDDPLEQIWPRWPVTEIQRQYEKLFLLHASETPAAQTPANWIKLDWRWALAGAFWWIWIFVGQFGPVLVGFGLALVLAVVGEVMRNHVLRDRSASFCVGAMAAPGLVLFASIFFTSF